MKPHLFQTFVFARTSFMSDDDEDELQAALAMSMATEDDEPGTDSAGASDGSAASAAAAACWRLEQAGSNAEDLAFTKKIVAKVRCVFLCE